MSWLRGGRGILSKSMRLRKPACGEETELNAQGMYDVCYDDMKYK